jgi:hypothetical protein
MLCWGQYQLPSQLNILLAELADSFIFEMGGKLWIWTVRFLQFISSYKYFVTESVV